MVKLDRFVVSILLLILVGAVTACNNDDENDVDNSLRNKLIKAWTLDDNGFVKLYEVDITTEYDVLEYTFKSDGSYTRNVNGDISSGTWRETDKTFTTLVLDDHLYVNILELTSETLRFTYINPGGRAKGVGEYEIRLSPK